MLTYFGGHFFPYLIWYDLSFADLFIGYARIDRQVMWLRLKMLSCVGGHFFCDLASHGLNFLGLFGSYVRSDRQVIRFCLKMLTCVGGHFFCNLDCLAAMCAVTAKSFGFA